MNLRSIVAVSVLGFAVTACGPGKSSSEADGTWVGTITTEGNVTTVVNESGSVWGGMATLVEELSIGVESGADEYMLGRVAGIAAAGDLIYVLDRQVPALRVYDGDGKHVTDIGGKGAGPGEFNVPSALAVAPDGRVFVRDTTQGRINVYNESGESVATWAIPSNFSTNRPLIVTTDGTLYNAVLLNRDPASTDRRLGLQGFRPDGSLTEVLPEPDFDFEFQGVIVRRGGGSGTFSSSLAPSPVWTLAPSGAVVSGIGDEYRYEVRHPDGEAMIVQRQIAGVPVDPDEADYYRRILRANVNRSARDDGIIEGDLDAIPGLKPAFRSLIVGHLGSVWVVRSGAGQYLPNCGGDLDDDPCWRSAQIVDVFDAAGRFLGEVDIPDGMQLGPRPYIRGDVIIARFEDEAGTPMVKRYRLVLPGQEERSGGPR